MHKLVIFFQDPTNYKGFKSRDALSILKSELEDELREYIAVHKPKKSPLPCVTFLRLKDVQSQLSWIGVSYIIIACALLIIAYLCQIHP